MLDSLIKKREYRLIVFMILIFGLFFFISYVQANADSTNISMANTTNYSMPASGDDDSASQDAAKNIIYPNNLNSNTNGSNSYNNNQSYGTSENQSSNSGDDNTSSNQPSNKILRNFINTTDTSSQQLNQHFNNNQSTFSDSNSTNNKGNDIWLKGVPAFMEGTWQTYIKYPKKYRGEAGSTTISDNDISECHKYPPSDQEDIKNLRYKSFKNNDSKYLIEGNLFDQGSEIKTNKNGKQVPYIIKLYSEYLGNNKMYYSGIRNRAHGPLSNFNDGGVYTRHMSKRAHQTFINNIKNKLNDLRNNVLYKVIKKYVPLPKAIPQQLSDKILKPIKSKITNPIMTSFIKLLKESKTLSNKSIQNDYRASYIKGNSEHAYAKSLGRHNYKIVKDIINFRKASKSVYYKLKGLSTKKHKIIGTFACVLANTFYALSKYDFRHNDINLYKNAVILKPYVSSRESYIKLAVRTSLLVAQTVYAFAKTGTKYLVGKLMSPSTWLGAAGTALTGVGGVAVKWATHAIISGLVSIGEHASYHVKKLVRWYNDKVSDVTNWIMNIIKKPGTKLMDSLVSSIGLPVWFTHYMYFKRYYKDKYSSKPTKWHSGTPLPFHKYAYWISNFVHSKDLNTGYYYTRTESPLKYNSGFNPTPFMYNRNKQFKINGADAGATEGINPYYRGLGHGYYLMASGATKHYLKYHLREALKSPNVLVKFYNRHSASIWLLSDNSKIYDGLFHPYAPNAKTSKRVLGW